MNQTPVPSPSPSASSASRASESAQVCGHRQHRRLAHDVDLAAVEHPAELVAREADEAVDEQEVVELRLAALDARGRLERRHAPQPRRAHRHADARAADATTAAVGTAPRTVHPKRGFVADGGSGSPRSCDDPLLLNRSGWYYDYNVGNPYQDGEATAGDCARANASGRLDARFAPMNWCLRSMDTPVASYVNRTFFMGFNGRKVWLTEFCAATTPTAGRAATTSRTCARCCRSSTPPTSSTANVLVDVGARLERQARPARDRRRQGAAARSTMNDGPFEFYAQ